MIVVIWQSYSYKKIVSDYKKIADTAPIVLGKVISVYRIFDITWKKIKETLK